MRFQNELNRYMNDLQTFDLDVFFHDDTFVEMLAYRQYLAKNSDTMSFEERRELFYLDEIVLSYYNLYKNRSLKGYEALSFKVLEKIARICKKYTESYQDMAA